MDNRSDVMAGNESLGPMLFRGVVKEDEDDHVMTTGTTTIKPTPLVKRQRRIRCSRQFGCGRHLVARQFSHTQATKVVLASLASVENARLCLHCEQGQSQSTETTFSQAAATPSALSVSENQSMQEIASASASSARLPMSTAVLQQSHEEDQQSHEEDSTPVCLPPTIIAHVSMPAVVLGDMDARCLRKRALPQEGQEDVPTPQQPERLTNPGHAVMCNKRWGCGRTRRARNFSHEQLTKEIGIGHKPDLIEEVRLCRDCEDKQFAQLNHIDKIDKSGLQKEQQEHEQEKEQEKAVTSILAATQPVIVTQSSSTPKAEAEKEATIEATTTSACTVLAATQPVVVTQSSSTPKAQAEQETTIEATTTSACTAMAIPAATIDSASSGGKKACVSLVFEDKSNQRRAALDFYSVGSGLSILPSLIQSYFHSSNE